MFDFAKLLEIAEARAKEAGITLDKYLAVTIVNQKHDKEEASKRQATDQERLDIDTALKSLNGNVSPDLPPSEVCEMAGVRQIQGTRSYARYQIKQLLLEHKKSND